MQDIKAFVAHSFNEIDRALIDSFIEHFRNLQKLIPYFTWDHAQEAEPVPVSGKVLTRMEDKNVFIAICSRTEQVVKDSSLLNWRIIKFGAIDQGAFEWKTSDWIIQEIGLAIGRDMKAIVFREDGVRRPGGLIGDIEYIPFSRDKLAPAFEKLHQMLGTLAPKVTSPAPKTTIESAPAEERKVESDSEWTVPAPGWDQERFDSALFHAIFFRKGVEAFNKIDAAYRASPLAKGEGLSVWEGRIEFLRIVNREKFDFDKLIRLSQNLPRNSDLLYFVGRGYAAFREHEQAAKKIEEAASRSPTRDTAIRYLGFAANEYWHAGLKDKARELTEELRKATQEDVAQKSAALSALEDEARIEKDTQLRLAIMERMVELDPGIISLRFNLAYQHSEHNNADMALHHYLKIPIAERSSITWNNLGVSFDHIKMPVRAVSAWRTSAKEKDTLAMSNLGYKMLGAGLFDEAMAECKTALGEEEPHKNVSELFTRLQEVRDDEQKKLDEALEKVQPKAAFYRKLGEASVRPSPKTIAKEWTSPFGSLEASVDGDVVKIEGAQEQPESALFGLLSGGAPVGSQRKVTHRIKYTGRLRGGAIFGDVKRSRDGETPSLLAEGMSNPDVLMYLNEDGKEIRVMENPRDNDPKFYSITRRSS